MSDPVFAGKAEAAPVRALDPSGELRLTPRQRECLILVEQGRSSTEIGNLLGLSAQTVNEHVTGACRRLGVRTRLQAVVSARAQGALDQHP